MEKYAEDYKGTEEMTQSEKQKLLPCPFCGGEAYLDMDSDHHGEWFNLGCKDSDCFMHMAFYTEPPDTQLSAIKQWNTRAITAERRDWRPIESAPHDRPIITCCMKPSEWTSKKAGYMAINEFDNGWPQHNEIHFPATHWMPLPQPPTAAGDLDITKEK